ncbi:hypothetical protein DL771_002788 [Monosporascus sp. 5C6A]|nr:hypothetical protein DL771_002788 [Monosporascus sp. 5C6A]
MGARSIVFVHGLTGDQERTWTASGAGLWPQTLLPSKIPNARILTFGYDANVVKFTKVVSSNTIGDHAGTFLAALATARNATEESMNRPIIFVAHSLGGLVCQDALRAAALSPHPHQRKILDCTRGIAFFGTPLAGSGLAPAAEQLARGLKLVWNTNSRILGVLRRDSEVLARIQGDFHRMLKLQAQYGYPEINITCFYEQLPLGAIGEEVVPKAAATYHPYEEIGIHRNHMDMVRFSTQGDEGFVQLVGVLNRWIDGLQDSPAAKASHDRNVAQSLERGRQGGASRSSISITGCVKGSNIVSGTQTVNGPFTIGLAK